MYACTNNLRRQLTMLATPSEYVYAIGGCF